MNSTELIRILKSYYEFPMILHNYYEFLKFEFIKILKDYNEF